MPTTRGGTVALVVAAVCTPVPVGAPPAVDVPPEAPVAPAEPDVKEPPVPPAVASCEAVAPATSPPEPWMTPLPVRRLVPDVEAPDFTSKLRCTAIPATEA